MLLKKFTLLLVLSTCMLFFSGCSSINVVHESSSNDHHSCSFNSGVYSVTDVTIAINQTTGSDKSKSLVYSFSDANGLHKDRSCILLYELHRHRFSKDSHLPLAVSFVNEATDYLLIVFFNFDEDVLATYSWAYSKSYGAYVVTIDAYSTIADTMHFLQYKTRAERFPIQIISLMDIVQKDDFNRKIKFLKNELPTAE